MPRTRTSFKPGHEVSPMVRAAISRRLQVTAAKGPAAGRPNVLEDPTGQPNELGNVALKMRKQGASIRQVAGELDVPKSVVGRLVKKFG